MLLTSSQQQFSVLGTLSDGSSASVPVTWSTSDPGGSVSASGLYSAGQAAGSYEIVAVESASGLADTAQVTVAASPAPSGAECQSSAPEWIWCDDFEQDRLSSYFEYDARNGSFVRSAGVGVGGSTGMRAHFNQGQTNAGSLHLAVGRTPQSFFRPVDAGTANYRELYWRFYVRHEAGWVGGGGDKLTRAFIFASQSSWAQAMIGHVWSGGGPGSWNYLLIDPASGTDTAGNLQTTGYNDFANLRWLGARTSQTPIFDAAHVGQWYCIEVQIKLNDAGGSNGIFRLMIDGTVEAQRTDLNWVGSYSSYGLNAVFLENFWNAGSAADQERYFDNFVVSTAPIGCG